MKTSTNGKRWRSAAFGLMPTMQPMSAITRLGSSSFSGLSDQRWPTARSSALWRTTHVLSTMTSASCALSMGA